MAEAIGDVTKSYGGDKDRMQAELVEKVAGMHKPTVEHVIEDTKPSKKEPEVPREPVNLR
jgi:hypothetical protein